MILIGLGGNLDSPTFGSPRATIEAVLTEFEARSIHVSARSEWYRTAPVPPSSQPWFINLVVSVETSLTAESLLEVLQTIETRFGRVRTGRNAARIVDIDILDYCGRISSGALLTLPHPRMHERAFVLEPLRDVARLWRHPVSGLSVDELLACLPAGQAVEVVGSALSVTREKGA